MAFYAWAEIKHTDPGDKDQKVKLIARGDRVTKADLPGITDADWDEKIRGGSIRDRQFPAPKGYQGSAIDYLRDSLRDAQAVSQVDEEEAMGQLAEIVEAKPTAEKKTTTGR